MFKKVSLFLAVSLLTSSCAGLISGSDQDIFVRSYSGHENVKASISGVGGSRDITIPATVKVKRSKTPLTIKIKESKCFKKGTQYASSNWNVMMITDFLWGLFGLTSTTADMGSGAAYAYDDTVFVNTNKKSSCK